VQIQLSDPTLTEDLIDFFRRRECRVKLVKRAVIEVEAHPTLGPEGGRLELDLLLSIWRSLHPGVELRSPGPRTRRPRARP
jgi:hypothetical protein